MNRNFRHSKPNTSNRGKASMNGPGPMNFRGQNSGGTMFHKQIHSSSSDHGPQQLDENPFSHLALEIQMDRPSANPFDKGVMPSFDDRAIDEDYRNETAKKFGGEAFGRKRVESRPPRMTRQATKELAIQPIALDDDVTPPPPPPPTTRIVKDVKAAAPSKVAPVVRESVTVKKIIPDVHDELDLDDIPPKLPVIMPSIDLKPQINIRSRNAIAPKEDVKPRFSAPPIRKPVAEPVIAKPVVQPAPAKPPIWKPVGHQASTKPMENSTAAKPIAHAPASSKPVIDYFGTGSSNEMSKQDVDQKEEYFRESQIEANKMLFGVEEPSRPLTNSEVSKRKKLILKLVDQKLKKKLTELMNQLGERSKAGESAPANAYGADNFADLMVPDSIPDNPNPEPTQNWTAYPSEATEHTWNNFQQPEMTTNQEGPWPVRPPMHQSNPAWMEPNPMNPFPPGIDPMMHMNRFPRMPPMRPHWNPNPWQPHMRPPDGHWQPPHNWNMPVRQMNPHLMQPNMNLMYPPDIQHPPFSVPPVAQLTGEKPAADIELELKEKEFLERTLMGTKNTSQRRDGNSNRRNSPEKSRPRSRPRQRQFPRDREKERRSRDEGKRNSEDRQRDRLSHDNRSSSKRSSERTVYRNALSPSRLSPCAGSPFDSRNQSSVGDNFRELMYGDNQFELMARSRSRESEDLRVRLSQRRNAHRSRSPTDLRNKLSDNRHNRNDDLRNQLADRSRRKRSRSHSRGRTSRKSAKLDSDDSEWMKFNYIVAMLMNIDLDADLTTEEMVERKEIMRLLLENPDLLELDDKFVYKFGKYRLNMAVQEAENILYPNGVPDERIASLISKKISTLPTEKKVSVPKDKETVPKDKETVPKDKETVPKDKDAVTKDKDTVPIEWIKFGNIIDQVLHLTIAERKNLALNEKRMLERDELLLQISEDPDSLLKLAHKYGHRNVEWASKYAGKILYHNGVRDKRVDQIIAKERKKALDRIAKMQRSRNSSESHNSRNSSESDSRSSSSEWNRLSALITKLVHSTLEKFEKMTREDHRRRDDLLVQMSRDPDGIRSNTKFTDNVDKAVLDDVIKKCKEIIASVKENEDKNVVTEFERQRTRLINYLNDKVKRSTAHEQIFHLLAGIFGKKDDKLTAEEKKERESLTEALIKDPTSIRTNTKALERIGDDKLVVDGIIADVNKILSPLQEQTRHAKKFHISSTKVIDIPFVVKIEDASDQLDDKAKTVLLKALRDMIDEIQSPPKPKLLQQRYVDRRVEVVCANLLTFEWLKRAITSDFKDKWSGADLKIERVPLVTKIPRDKLKSVVAVFKDTRATLPFDDILRELRRENPKLYPERWELQDARGEDGDYKKKTIGIDIESLAALEQMNRVARLGRSLVNFDISYMGDNIPNFEATCE